MDIGNLIFKGLMWVLIVIIFSAAIYALIWKLATVLLLFVIMAPFVMAIIWRTKKALRQPARSDTTSRPYTV